jgi:hypothetical protein
MANTIQDAIYQNFLEVSQQQAEQVSQATQSLADLVQQATAVQQDMAQQNARLADPPTRSVATGSTQSAGESSGLSTVFDVFKNGLGISPLIKGILGLFSGGDATTPAPLVKYALPPAVQFQAAEVGGQVMSADYGQSGTARAYGVPSAQDGGASAGTGASQITVNVQAMDARSFMDRSSDIALAVRDAMLNLNSINDVVNDL